MLAPKHPTDTARNSRKLTSRQIIYTLSGLLLVLIAWRVFACGHHRGNGG